MGRLIMNDDASTPIDEPFSLWLADGDDAIARGQTDSACYAAAAPAELRARLERDLAWCQFVRRHWSRRGPAVSARAAPTQIGRFLIRRELGRGGFGVVFLAHDPLLNREVALKVPRLEGLLDPVLHERFRQEARAAAGLDHPSIVPVYETGEDNGVCYIASAYCPGLTLSTWLREQMAPIPAVAVARLVATLADAVDHAHRRGVLHRDLKPANILLERDEGRGARDEGKDTYDSTSASSLAPRPSPLVPKITDFGLAKLVEANTATLQKDGPTYTGNILGTPSYMAPEQASGGGKAVGPTADVYALGTILYEMLIGRPPLRGDTPLDTLFLVRTADPVPPTRLRPGLARDVETICLKCLAKEPAGRYATAADLAADLRRFLNGEPIHARPASVRERAVKWARRRPALAGLVAVSVTAVLSLLTVVLVANARLQQQRDHAREKQEEAEQQRQRAVAHYRAARAAVDQMLTRVGFERLADVPLMETVRRELLEEALKAYQRLADLESDDPELQFETGKAWRRLGELHSFLGDHASAARSYRQALDCARQAQADLPARPDVRYELAASLENLTGILEPTQHAEALALLDQSLALHEQLVADVPADPGYRAELAVAYHTQGRWLQAAGRAGDAEKALQRSVALLEQVVADAPTEARYERSLAVHRRDLGVFLARQKRLTEAEPVFRRDLDYWAKLAEESPNVPRYQARAADAAFHLGNLLTELRQPTAAMPLLRRAIERRQQLVNDYPRAPGYHLDVAAGQEKLARLLRERGDHAAAAPLLEQAVDHLQKAIPKGSRKPSQRSLLSSYCWLLADSRLHLGVYAEAARGALELPTICPDGWRECYQAARLLTRCVASAQADSKLEATVRRERIEQYSHRAVECLRDSFRRGCTEHAFVQTDRGLDVLRTREDFQRLMRELSAK
jgi:serine/threonine protein kinase